MLICPKEQENFIDDEGVHDLIDTEVNEGVTGETTISIHVLLGSLGPQTHQVWGNSLY